MCGIAGIISLKGEPITRETVERMTTALEHRGPDDSGLWIDGSVGLGHRRLSILDLSPNGHQPMSNEDGSIWIVFNGEIYNCEGLREKLLLQGHQFRSKTDTEVLVHLYEEKQERMLEELNGMFAFAIWDRKRRRLFLARDRLGIKPLFFSFSAGTFLFGSEIKALLASGALPRSVDVEGLFHYLSLNYLPAPRTMFEGVSQLRPAEYLILENGQSSVRTYWRVPSEVQSISFQEALARFDSLLEASVRGQLLSDVPVGAFLSGGLDSSTVAHYMKRVSPAVKTFSIGFREKSYDETPYARQVSQRIGTEHFEETVTPDAKAILEQIVYHGEEPTADASMIAVWYLSRMTRRHVTVALSGDGADELLAGYETYQANYLAAAYRKVPEWLRHSVIDRFVRSLPAREGKISLEYKLKRFVAAAHLSPEEAHFSWRIIFDRAHKQQILSADVRKGLGQLDTFDLCREYFGNGPGVNRYLEMDTRFYLPNDMLTKVDRMSMAHSLEVRVPFLDHELVEFLAGLPPQWKLHRFTSKKYLMKRLMKDRLPSEILHRRKAGFNVPLNRWFKHELRDYVRDRLSPGRLSRMGVFEPREVIRLLDEHEKGTADWSYQIYCLLYFALWHARFIDVPHFVSSPRKGD